MAGAFRAAPAGQITVDGASQDVVVCASARRRPTSHALRALPLTTPRGVVPLDQVADVTEVDGPVEVTRIDGNRSATVTGTATGSRPGRGHRRS